MAQYDKVNFVILSVAKNPQILRCALNLWILRYAQYDKAHQYNKI